MKASKLIPIISIVVLSACGGGGGSSDPGPTPSPEPTASPEPTPTPAPQTICQTIGGGTAMITSDVSGDCAGCAIADAERAVDDDLGTASTLTTPVSGTLTLRGTAQSGVVFPAGLSVGAFVGKPPAATNGSFEITVTAYLGETEVDSEVVYLRVGTSEVTTGRTVTTDDGNFYGINSISGSFDSIEIKVARTAVVSDPDFSVYELCTRE